jgi:hypothetical protein
MLEMCSLPRPGASRAAGHLRVPALGADQMDELYRAWCVRGKPYAEVCGAGK